MASQYDRDMDLLDKVMSAAIRCPWSRPRLENRDVFRIREILGVGYMNIYESDAPYYFPSDEIVTAVEKCRKIVRSAEKERIVGMLHSRPEVKS